MNRMLTVLAAVALPSLIFAGEPQLNPPPAPGPVAQSAPAVPNEAAPSLIVVAQDESVVDGFEENAAVSRRLVDSLVRTLTGAATPASAWREIVGPADRVGIKVTATGGRYFATRRGVVAAVVAGLHEAGYREVFVWDRDAAALRDAGFTAGRLGCDVRSIEQPKGWDREGSLAAPVLGKLIWGDAQFNDRLPGLLRDENDQLSAKSHIAAVLSRDATKWINIPALSDAPGMGVHGAFYSAVVSNVDNWRRFSTDTRSAAGSLPELYLDPRIGGKCALHILDAIAVTYAGGPAANPAFSKMHCTLYASRDPVALDATGLRLIEEWCTAAKLPGPGTKAAWLSAASAAGNADEKMIRFKTAR